MMVYVCISADPCLAPPLMGGRRHQGVSPFIMHNQWSILVHSGVCVNASDIESVLFASFLTSTNLTACVCKCPCLLSVSQTQHKACLLADHISILLPGPFTRKLQDTSEYYRHILAISGICRHTVPCAESKHLLRSVGTPALHMPCSSHPHQPKTLRENTGKKHQSCYIMLNQRA